MAGKRLDFSVDLGSGELTDFSFGGESHLLPSNLTCGTVQYNPIWTESQDQNGSFLMSRQSGLFKEQKLAKFRKSTGMEREAFASRLGVNPRTWNHYEAGDRRVPPEVLAKMAREFQLNLNWLLADIGPMRFSAPSDEAQARALEAIGGESAENLIRADHVETAYVLTQESLLYGKLPVQKQGRLCRLIASKLNRGQSPEDFRDWIRNSVELAAE